METRKYLPVCFSNHQLQLPEMNWQVSVSVDMFNFSDETPFRVFWHTEPEALIPLEEKLIRNHKFYDLILTYNQQVLSQCANAKLFPPGSVWCQSSDVSQKALRVSYLTSSKNMCPGHQYRQDIYNCLPEYIDTHFGSQKLIIPVTKHKSPPYLATKHELLVPYQFSIVMENCQMTNNFTEKLNDALATKTIPIYYGCPNVGDFYNPASILSWNGTSDLFAILGSLTPDLYDSKKAAIDENYERALKYADRTGNIVRAIQDAWTPRINIVHSGEPNIP